MSIDICVDVIHQSYKQWYSSILLINKSLGDDNKEMFKFVLIVHVNLISDGMLIILAMKSTCGVSKVMKLE